MAITRSSNKTSSKQTGKKMATSVIAAPGIATAPALAPSSARLVAAHTKFMSTQKGTPAYDKAWEELVDALFVNAK